MDKHPDLYPLWEEALRAKYYNESVPYGRKEYEKLLGDWNCSCNFPGTLVAEDLIKAYPKAKVILTCRDVDKWIYSMKQSVDSAVTWKSFDYIAPFDTEVMGPWWSYHKFQHRLRKVLIKDQGNERNAYINHYETVRKLVPKEQLLEYHISDGWDSLCEFLGRDVPDLPFPHVNSTDQFLAGRTKRWWRAFGYMMVKIAGSGAVAGAAAGMYYWLYKR